MRVLRAFLPLIVWMSVIFAASTELGSTRHSSRFIGPFLRWLVPEISNEAIRAVQLVVRKGAHLTEYAVLAMITWRCLNVYRLGHARWKEFQWHWRDLWLVLPLCAAYALTDEFHQTFVSSRQGSLVDVMIDTTGALCGLLLVWVVGRQWKRW